MILKRHQASASGTSLSVAVVTGSLKRRARCSSSFTRSSSTSQRTESRTLLGDSPSVSLQEGLATTIAWFRTHVPVTDAVLASLDVKTWTADPVEPWMIAVAF